MRNFAHPSSTKSLNYKSLTNLRLKWEGFSFPLLSSWTSLPPPKKKKLTISGQPLLGIIAGTLERSLDLFDSVRLNNVADLDVVVALDIKTTVHTHMNLLDIVLETFE